MRFTIVILGAVLCLPLWAQSVSEDKSDEALEAAAEQLVNEGAAVAGQNQEPSQNIKEAASSTPAAAGAETSISEKKESEIPIVIKPKKEASESSNVIFRLLASVGLIFITAGALIYAAKRWGKPKDKGGNKARIEMLHQFHLGPKRSIALIRVSGEAILVGITDQNINMLKTVALIDDELEGAMKADFNNFLEDEFAVEDVRHAIKARA